MAPAAAAGLAAGAVGVLAVPEVGQVQQHRSCGPTSDELTELLGIDHHTTLASQIRKVGVTLPLKSDLRSIEN